MPAVKPSTILIVEDEPDHINILREMLGLAGHKVITAFGGDDALQKVRARRPDLVLTDLAMPAANGVRLIDALKSAPDTKDIPVVAVTAHIWDGLAQAAKSAGCDGFIAKPFTKEKLRQELEKHLPRLEEPKD